MDSLEKRWAKDDQELFIAATLMNPFYGPSIFDTEGEKADQMFTPSAITALWVRLYRRFWPTCTEAELGKLETASKSFLGRKGMFQSMQRDMETHERMVKEEVSIKLFHSFGDS
jgi:hypothetical protein